MRDATDAANAKKDLLLRSYLEEDVCISLKLGLWLNVQLINYVAQFQTLNDSMSDSTLTDSTLGLISTSETEAKSERVLNYMDYPTKPESKDSQVDESSFSYMESPPAYPSLPTLKIKSESQNYECFAEPNIQSEHLYKSMSQTMNLLQSTKSEILKIFEEKQNQLQTETQNDRSHEAMAKMLGTVEKRRKQLLAETIYKIRTNIDDLEQVSRLF